MEKIIETKTCKHCNIKFEITDKDLEFYEKISPIFDGKKYNIPTPILCSECRQQRRLSFRNERKLYKRKCDATGKNIISMYYKKSDYKIYSPEYWWSDKWDALNYGKNFDFNKGFFEQFDKLYKKVPLYSLSVLYLTLENSKYNNASGYLKNCYTLVNSDDNEGCLYGKGINRSNYCVDNLKIYDSDNLYECMNCYNCNNSLYLTNSKNCYKCDFSIDLINCKNCFGCSNLNSKEYYLFNKKLSKEIWKNEISKILQKYSPLELRKKILNSKRIVKEKELEKNENSTGNYLFETSNCASCYDCEKIIDSKYCYDLKMGDKISDNNYDVTQFGKGISNCYEGITIGYNIDKCFFSIDLWDNSNNCYYVVCSSGNVLNCFGCIGLRNKEYCILNKQYTKEEYNKLVPKIIEHMKKYGEWGEFFPSSLSPFGYNETEAQEYFPLEKKQAAKTGFNWSNYEAPFPKVDKIIPANKLPENIADIPDDILNWAIECEITKKPFKIIKPELEFYRKHNLPIPRRHPDQRHLDRIKLRNPRKLFDRKCNKCKIDMKTTYSPDRKEIVYCEECYNKEVY